MKNDNSKLKVSIIILSWNTKGLLKQCLESLILNTEYQIRNTEVIVVDNGSTDGSVEYIKNQKLKYILNKKNLGFSRGNNQGIRIAGGEYVMLLNSDTVVKKGTVEKLIKFLDSHPEVGAISPLVLNEDGSVQKDPCYLKFPSPLLAFFYYNKILRQLALNFFPQVLFSTMEFRKPIEVDQLPGAALMVRKSILGEIGGLDEDYELYFEDTNLCWKMRKLGYRLMVVPQAKIVHSGRKSIAPLIRKEGINKFYLLNFKSLFLFCEKNYPEWKTALIKLVVFFHLFSTFKFNLLRKLIRK